MNAHAAENEGTPVDFGFAEVIVPPGTHVCQIYDDSDERTDAFVRFILKGLELNEMTAGFTDHIAASDVESYLPGALPSESVRIARTSDTYFVDNRFDPDRMLRLLREFHHDAETAACPGCRVIGEMTPEIQHKDGADRLLEYEARVNILLRDYPMTVMCQYNAHEFSGSTLMDVLKAHALIVVRGTIVHNPYYVTPESILGE